MQKRVILVALHQPRDERRCALAHATAHLDLGHNEVMSPVIEAREENAADQLAARRLIPVDDLIDCARAGMTAEEVAAHLDVTSHTLQVRNAHLHPSKRAALRRAAH